MINISNEKEEPAIKRNDVVEMMHSLNCLSYGQLCALADHEGISHGSHSKVELITIIIAHRAADPVKSCDDKPITNRKKYYLESEGNKFYLELTQEQVNFFEWCTENDINLDDAELKSMMKPIRWEAP